MLFDKVIISGFNAYAAQPEVVKLKKECFRAKREEKRCVFTTCFGHCHDFVDILTIRLLINPVNEVLWQAHLINMGVLLKVHHC